MQIHIGPVKSLAEEILLIQVEDLFSNTCAEFDRLNKKNIKKMITLLAPFSILTLMSIITKDSTPLVIGTTYVGGMAIIQIIKDAIKDTKKAFPSKNVTKLYPDDVDILKYKFQESDDFLKENISVPDDSPNTNAPYVFKKLEDVKKRLTYEYNVLSGVYKIPPLKITDTEWERIYSLFLEQAPSIDNPLDFIYEKINQALRLTIAIVLLKKYKEINLSFFIRSLDYIKTINSQDIDYQHIIDELSKLLPNLEVIDLNLYLKK